MNFISLFVSVTLTFVPFFFYFYWFVIFIVSCCARLDAAMRDAISCCVSWCFATVETPPLFLLLYFMEAMTVEDGLDEFVLEDMCSLSGK